MKFAAEFKYVDHEEDFESLLEYDTEKITDILEDFINYLEGQGLVIKLGKTENNEDLLSLTIRGMIQAEKLIDEIKTQTVN